MLQHTRCNVMDLNCCFNSISVPFVCSLNFLIFVIISIVEMRPALLVIWFTQICYISYIWSVIWFYPSVINSFTYTYEIIMRWYFIETKCYLEGELYFGRLGFWPCYPEESYWWLCEVGDVIKFKIQAPFAHYHTWLNFDWVQCQIWSCPRAHPHEGCYSRGTKLAPLIGSRHMIELRTLL